MNPSRRAGFSEHGVKVPQGISMNKDTGFQLEHRKTLALAGVSGEGRDALTDETRKINSAGSLSTLNTNLRSL